MVGGALQKLKVRKQCVHLKSAASGVKRVRVIPVFVFEEQRKRFYFYSDLTDSQLFWLDCLKCCKFPI